MNYRRGWLRRVGNLTIDYNRWGEPLFFGSVGFDGFYNDYYYGNAWNANFGVGFNWNVGAVCVYNDPFFYGNEFRNSYRRVREDNNFIYYRANDGVNVSRDRIIRRRKPSSTASNGQTVRGRRDGNNTSNTTNQRRRSVQNESTNNTRRRSVQSSSTNNRRRAVPNNTNSERRRSVQNSSTNNRRRSVQNESNNNRRRSEVNTSQNRRKKVVRDESTRKRSSQVNRTNKKKREVRNATTPSKRTQNEVKRRKRS
jgi:hypothetical protein